MNVRRTIAILGLAGVVAALAVAGIASAQTPVPEQQSGTNYHQLFLDKLAAVLGIQREALDSALIEARNGTVDQAVQDGRLSQERADAIKSREELGRFGFGFGDFGRGHKGGKMGGAFIGGGQMLDAVAGALGTTPEALTEQLRSGSTLADLTAGKEQAVKDAIIATITPQLEQAVANGRITQEQADQKLEEIRNSDLSELGRLGPRSRGMFRGERPEGFAPGTAPSSGQTSFEVRAL